MNRHFGAAAAVLLFAQPVIPAAAQTLADYAVYADGEADLGTVIITGTVAGRPVDTDFTSLVSGGTTASSDSLSAVAAYNSAAMAAMAPTPGTSFTGAPNATLSSPLAGVTVYSLTGAQWESLSNLSFAGLSTGVIVNVGGATLTNAFNISLGGLSPSDVVFNFYEATAIDFGGGHNFYGTILAPDAHVKLTNMNLTGAVISATFESPNSIINHEGYGSFLTPPAAIPEPAGWAMMILGFGAAGVALRRRRWAVAAA